MTEAVFGMCKGQAVDFLMQGHAGFAKSGQDIVCAAFSALSQSALLALETRFGTALRYELQDAKVYFSCPDFMTEEERIYSQGVFAVLREGLENLSRSYPQHIKIQYKEV